MLNISEIKLDDNYAENLEALKLELSKLDDYEVTSKNYADSKKLKQKISSIKTMVEDSRKDFKKECLIPYESELPKFKAITTTLDTKIDEINVGILTIDTEEKLSKRKEIEDIWNIHNNTNVKFDRIFNNQWLNKTYSLNKVENDIIEMVAKYESELIVIDGDPIAEDHYYKTLNLAASITKSKEIASVMDKVDTKPKSTVRPLSFRKKIIQVDVDDISDDKKQILINFLEELDYEYKEIK